MFRELLLYLLGLFWRASTLHPVVACKLLVSVGYGILAFIFTHNRSLTHSLLSAASSFSFHVYNTQRVILIWWFVFWFPHHPNCTYLFLLWIGDASCIFCLAPLFVKILTCTRLINNACDNWPVLISWIVLLLLMWTKYFITLFFNYVLSVIVLVHGCVKKLSIL